MYKNLNKTDWLTRIGLPTDYRVDALVVVGTGRHGEEMERFNLALQAVSPDTKPTNIIDSFFGNILEFKLGDKRVWFDLVYGGAYLSEVIHLACMFGSKKNFLIGTCGGLQKELNAGDIIIPTYTYGNESSTRMYQREIEDHKHYSDKHLNAQIIEKMDKKYTIHQGPVITCQAMLAESQEDVDNWEKAGYLGIEMESSTMFAVSNHFNVPSTAILHVADNLVKNELVRDESYNASKEFRNQLKVEKYKVVFENILSR